MANRTSENPWVLDTDGIVKTLPVMVKYMKFVPNAVTDTALIRHWNPNSNKSTQEQVSCTVTSAKTITSTGAFVTANVAAGDIIEITASASGNNVGTYLVESRDSDNAITIHDDNLTNEATKLYNFNIYTGRVFHEFLVSEDSIIPDVFDPHGYKATTQGFAVDSLSGSATIYVYV